MKSTISFVFCMLTFCVTAQALVIEKSEIPSPEKEVLFFLQDNYFNNLDNYKGAIASVFKTTTTYIKDKSTRTFDTLTITSVKQNIALNQLFTSKKLIDKIGIDSVVKKNKNTYELYKFDEESDYTWQRFTLKNNLITEYLDNGAVEYVNTTYSYNTFNRIDKIITKNDYGIKKVILGLTKNDGKVVGKTVFKKHPKGTLVIETIYSYKDGLLVAISKNEKLYKFKLTENVLDLLHHFLTTTYYHKKAVLKFYETVFTYNKNKQLIKVVENNSKTYWASLKKENTTKIYNLTYKPNKLIVNTNLPEKKEYEYIFDAHQNPIEISSFGFVNNKKVLAKKTTLKIKYK